MEDGNGESDVWLVPEVERKWSDIMQGSKLTVRDIVVHVHPHKPWVLFTPSSSTLQVWNYEDGTHVAFLKIPDVGDANRAQFIPQKGWKEWILVERTTSFGVYEWQGSKLRCVRMLMTECASVTRAVAVHHSLPCLLAGFENKDVFLFYWGRKWEKIKLQGHSTAIRAVAFHPTESQIFATASDDDIIKVWNLEERSVVRTLKVAEGVRTLKVAEGSDLNIGACRRGGLISLVSPLESDKKYKMPVDWDRILSPVFCTRIMGFCPRVGKSLLIAFHKETIQVWDYKEGVCMAKWEAHDTPTRSAFFHPRLPYIFTVAKEGKIRIWSETSYRQVASYFFGYADISSMIPCGTCNKLVLGGRGMFKVVAVDTGREEQENEAQKQMQSPSTESAQTSAGATTTGDEAVFALRTPVSEELENRIVQIRLEFEEKIKREVAIVELNCKKALETLEGLIAEHQKKERIQAERVQLLEKRFDEEVARRERLQA